MKRAKRLECFFSIVFNVQNRIREDEKRRKGSIEKVHKYI